MESSLNRGNRMLEKVFEGKMVRTTIKDDGVWFVAKDVAKCLGYSDTNKLTRYLEDYEKGIETVELCDPLNVGVSSNTEKLSNETLPSFDDM